MATLKQVGVDMIVPEETSPAAAPKQEPNAAAGILFLALKALSQRALWALAAIRNLILAGSVFWLCLAVIAAPTEPQLIGVGMYALFVLAVMWIWRG